MKRSERRSAARLAASQALYQMEIADKGLADILAEFEAHWIGHEIEGDSYAPAELAFFRDVVSGVLRDQLPIDRGLDDALAKGWPLKRVEALMRAILRAAFYELRNRPDVPARVAVTEYVDVAAAFFGPEESGMINAVLDALARQTRPDEFEAGRCTARPLHLGRALQSEFTQIRPSRAKLGQDKSKERARIPWISCPDRAFSTGYADPRLFFFFGSMATRPM